MSGIRLLILLMAVLAAAPAASVVLPLEIHGDPGITRSITFTVPSGGSARSLALVTHNLTYAGKGSVRLNGGSWTALSNDTVELDTLPRRFGGIGGVPATIAMRLPLAAGAARDGANTFDFRFSAGDGRSSGWRVLAIGLRDGSSAELIPSGTFSDEDPSTWTPPRPGGADIAAGATLWANATLVSRPGGSQIRASCAACHTVDGRDLKYFNFSNDSIIQRSRFHGLNQIEGEQIASFIRSQSTPAPGRPWNPPYQPGPGLSSRPVTEWAAGAGVAAVLPNDEAILGHLPGGGTDLTAMVAPGGRIKDLPVHDIPIHFQLLDWNHWLPDEHPLDAFPDIFPSHPSYQRYLRIRQGLSGQLGMSAADYIYSQLLGDLDQWSDSMYFPEPELAGMDQDFANRLYAVYVWSAVKQWEIMQEFSLESLAPRLEGYNAERRQWFSNRHIFNISPSILRIPARFGLAGARGDQTNNDYFANTWYEAQMQLNSSARHFRKGGHHTIDWGYQDGVIHNIARQFHNGEDQNVLGYRSYTNIARYDLRKYQTHDGGLDFDYEGDRDLWWGWELRNNSVFSKAGWFDFNHNDAQAAAQQFALAVYWQRANRIPAAGWKRLYGETSYEIFVPGPDTAISPGVMPDDLARQIMWMVPRMRARAPQTSEAILDAYLDFGQMMWPASTWGVRAARASAAAPGGLTATAGIESATLTWQPVSGAASYNVRRAESPGGPFRTVAFFVAGTSYRDAQLTASITYSYSVQANLGRLVTADSAVVSATAASGLVGRWSFDEAGGEALTDASVSASHGRLIGDAVRVPGRAGSALATSRGNFAGVPYNLGRWLGGTATVTAWIRPTAATANHGLLGKLSSQRNNAWGLFDGSGRIGINVAGTWVVAPQTVVDGQWHHLAMTRAADSGRLEVWLDGVLRASGNARTGAWVVPAFSLGRVDNGVSDRSREFPGAIDDLRIYSRVLSAGEIEAVRDAPGSGAPLPGDANGDGSVDGADVVVVRGQFGRQGVAISDVRADLDGNNRVDAIDLGILTRALTP